MKIYNKIGVLSVSKLLSNLTTLFIFILLSRTVDPDSYGLFRKILVYLLFFANLMTLGLPNSLLKFGRDDQDFNRKLISRSLFMVGPALVFVLTVGVILAFFTSLSIYANLLILFLILVLLFFSESALMIRNRVFWSGIYSFFIKGGMFLVPGLLLFFLRDVPGAFNWTIAYVAVLLVLFLSLIRFTPKCFDIDLSMKEQYLFSFTVWFAALAGILMLQSDKLIVSALKSNETFAIFSNGAFEIPVIGIINGAIFTAATPLFSRYFREHKHQEVIRLWASISQKSMLIMLPTFAFLIFRSEELMAVLFGDFYRRSAMVFLLYLFFIPLRVYIFSGIFMATDLQKYYLKHNMIAAVSNAVLTYLFVLKFGMYAAPITSLLLTVYLVAVFFRKLIRVFRVPLSEIVLFRRAGFILVISFAISILLKLVLDIPNIFINISVHFLIFSVLLFSVFVYKNYIPLRKIWKY